MADSDELTDLLTEWYAELDEMGYEFWEEYELELAKHPFTL